MSPEEQRRLLEAARLAFHERDVDALVATMHPKVVIELHGGFADVMGRRFQGREGARRFFTDWFAAFSAMTLEFESIREADGGLVALTVLEATGDGSDAAARLESAAIYGFEDGLAISVAFYYRREDALEAAGLR